MGACLRERPVFITPRRVRSGSQRSPANGLGDRGLG